MELTTYKEEVYELDGMKKRYAMNSDKQTLFDKAISESLLIEGWMPDIQLVELMNIAYHCDSFLEIGCFRGKTTKALSVVSSGIISTVDNFIGTEENIATTDKDKESNKQLFINNLKPELDSGKVILYSMESGEACELLFKQDKWFDCIFIDGSHDYESVKRDICMWSRLVKKGGILCGHDYNISHFGVKDAVDELFPNAITRPEGLITDIYCQSIWIQPL